MFIVDSQEIISDDFVTIMEDIETVNDIDVSMTDVPKIEFEELMIARAISLDHKSNSIDTNMENIFSSNTNNVSKENYRLIVRKEIPNAKSLSTNVRQTN